MKLIVAILNYRVTDLTIDCLRSLADEVAQVPGTQVAICENGTGDDAAAKIEKAIDDNGWRSWCSLTAISPNRGFTGGNNHILRPLLQTQNPPQYVWLLNADTIVHPNALKLLVDFMDQHSDVRIAGSRLEDPDGTPQRSAFRFQTPLGEFEGALKLGLVSRLLKHWVVAPPPPQQACKTDWVAGASMIIRGDVLRDVGLLDEGYFTYYDDIDICFNAQKAGWPTWYVPESRVVHLVGQATGVRKTNIKRKPPYLLEARRRYFLKNHNAVYAAMADLGLIAGLTLWRLRVMLTGKPDSTPKNYLQDTIRHSVFLTGFRLKDVQNPALQPQEVPAGQTRP
jgi:N-acetylglucosaminyl-diphospho-decaprenol L-rhamnosyltransferase